MIDLLVWLFLAWVVIIAVIGLITAGIACYQQFIKNKGSDRRVLFKSMDKKKTKDRVNCLLVDYHSIRRLAGAPINQKVTATYSFEPKSFSGVEQDKFADGLAHKNANRVQLDKIHRAINRLDAHTRQRLYLRYMSEDYYDYEIISMLGESHNTYYRKLEQAQLEFAEAYDNGSLIIWKK